MKVKNQICRDKVFELVGPASLNLDLELFPKLSNFEYDSSSTTAESEWSESKEPKTYSEKLLNAAADVFYDILKNDCLTLGRVSVELNFASDRELVKFSVYSKSAQTMSGW